MKSEKRNGPFDNVLRALSLGLFRYPYLKVLDAIVILNAILVMHVLERFELAAKMLLKKKAVLKYGLTSSGTGNVTAFLLSAPTGRAALLPSHTGIAALWRAVTTSSVWLAHKRLAAVLARFFSHCGLTSSRVSALVRAVGPTISMGGFSKKTTAAVRASLANGWITLHRFSMSHDHVSPFRNEFGEYTGSLLVTQL